MTASNDTVAEGKTCGERVRLMYKYAAQLAWSVKSGRVTPEILGKSYYDQNAVVKAIELVGEEAWQLLKAGYDLGESIDLGVIAGMRHRLVHHYDGIDWNLAEQAAFEDIPELVGLVREAAAERGIVLGEVDGVDDIESLW